MNDLVSIIVPIYNAEKYLLDCLNSIIEQSYKNIEIILVDDGSTDQSGLLVKKFCDKHKQHNIQFFVKENGGQSSARNLGIKNATGEYFIFVDSDDLIGITHVEGLIQAIKKNDSKLAMCRYSKYIMEITDTLSSNIDCIKGDFLFLVNYLTTIDYPSISAWAKIYHKSLLKNTRFYEGIIYEDGLFFYEIINQVEEIVLVDSISYYYRTTENSTLTSRISQKNFDILKKNQLTFAFFKNHHPEALNHFYKKAMNVNDFMAVKCVKDKQILSKEFLERLYFQNKEYSKSFFPRNLIYASWPNYYFFILVISKFYNTNQLDKNNFFKRLIKKTIK